jgi:hypothetical protein
MRFLDKALDNPAATFASPAEVVKSGRLSREEKIQVLRRWEYEARLLEVAQDENMMSGTPSVLSDILKALMELDADSRPSAPTRSGGA